jgi:uncharacterized protein YkwD
MIAGLIGLGMEYKTQITAWWQSFDGDDNTPENIAEYIELCNAYRQECGLEPLVFTDDLNRNAYERVKEIQKIFSHNSPGKYNEHLAENIVKGNNLTISESLWEWQNSYSHDVNLMGGKYSGYAIEDGCAVQLFSDYITIDGVPQLPPGMEWNNSPSPFITQ